ncbi:protoheme IX farnesyltransferase [Desulfopila sp. IMCC35006]|uniref:UbiA family prenyltransferase n=1 Tax=Desulfopila sp. IMCC35006 TaxID=2569542 RepID=UPI0010AD77A2|nr:UbiA family prenyltransferase [Desulfopila sp. IMCC35006]TKB27318.1 protoheme IX farnesyltransferase [Desulfopila sp. IMCC35006]
MMNLGVFFKTLPKNMRWRLKLTKAPLCLLIGCSALFGTILADPVIGVGTLLVGSGVFVLAMGAATLNSLQEYRLDSELLRTRNRPLPTGILSLRQAGWQAAILCVAGLLLLFWATRTAVPSLTAVFAVFVYNGVYTPLKKRTVLAIVPGAVCGALPPYIGWLAGGGGPLAYPALLLFALLVLWQIPHFWLVLLNFKDEYVKSSLPHFLQLFGEDSLKRFFITWLGALVLVMFMFLGLSFSLSFIWRALIIANGCLLLGAFIYVLVFRQKSAYRALFIILNAALLVHMLVLAAGRIMAYR